MRILFDFEGRAVRLTAERVDHIRARREMGALEGEIASALMNPDVVVESLSDPEVWLYHRRDTRITLRRKWLRVVVKHAEDDAFILTAYTSDRVKRGRTIWPLER